MIDTTLFTIKEFSNKEIFFVTIAAGITTGFIEKRLGEGTRVVRVMPNLPVVIGEGISAICLGSYATKEDEEIAFEIFSSIGEVVMVDEDLMDVVTGLSGSGPAYILKVIEAICEGGIRGGLDKDISLRLVTQTTLGTAKLIMESGLWPDELCKRVISPGGTTLEGLKVLDKRELRSILMEAVAQATRRSKELSRG